MNAAAFSNRGTVIFAMLPDRRALENPDAIACKLAGGPERSEGSKWHLVELKNEQDLAVALACLDEAYRNAGR